MRWRQFYRTLLYASLVLVQLQFTCTSLLETTSQPAFTCSELTIETLEQGVKYVQS